MHTAQKMKFFIKDFFSKCDQIRRPNPQFPADLVTFTEQTLNGKLHLLCSRTPRAPHRHLDTQSTRALDALEST